MKLPKYITHPALLIAGAALILYAVWLKTPNASEMVEKHLFQILDFLPGGYVLLDDKEGRWLLDDKRFQEIEADKLSKLQEFFVGKFVDIPPENTRQRLSFPLELYDPRCFAADTEMRAAATMCPLIIEK